MPTLFYRRTIAPLLVLLLVLVPLIVDSFPVDLPTAPDLVSVSYVDPLDDIPVADDSSASQEERITKLEAELAALKKGESLDADNKAIWVAGDDYQCGLEAPSSGSWEKYNVTAWLEEQLRVGGSWWVVVPWDAVWLSVQVSVFQFGTKSLIMLLSAMLCYSCIRSKSRYCF